VKHVIVPLIFIIVIKSTDLTCAVQQHHHHHHLHHHHHQGGSWMLLGLKVVQDAPKMSFLIKNRKNNEPKTSRKRL